MRSSVSVLVMLAAGGAAPPHPRTVPTPPAPMLAPPEPAPPDPSTPLPPEVAAADGPSGTAGAGLEAYDSVGYASWYGEELSGNRTATGERFDPAAITAAHRTLPLGSIAEVTSLDTGRTILVRINDRGPMRRDREIDLSRGAAGQLGANGSVFAIRVRGIVASPADIAALRSGQRASARLDAPPALLAALRRKLNRPDVALTMPAPVVSAPPSRARFLPPRPSVGTSRVVPTPLSPARVSLPRQSSTAAAVAPGGRYQVQVATFSTEARANTLARTLDGNVQRAGALWRVRLGPYRDLAGAKRGRDGAARRGYGDAHILTDP